MEGFWTAFFETQLGIGSGVAYFRDGKIYGGDAGYTYLGQYEVRDGVLTATARISPFAQGTPSVFGSIGKAFGLTITGTFAEDEITGTGTSDMFPGIRFGVRLKRVQ